MKLTACDLTKKYGNKKAVDHLNLELQEGIIGLLGPNGAGKTTFIRMLCDLLRPTSGRVLLDGEDIHEMGEDYRDLLGYLPQKVGYYPWFTAEKYLMYLAALKGLSKNDAKQKTETLLKQVGLFKERRKKMGSMSGGMLQRMGIAQALLNDPRILILDEPTAGLDPQERIRFRTMLAGLARERLVLLSTHIVSDVEHIATDVVLLKQGQVVRHGSHQALCQEFQGKVYTVQVEAAEAQLWNKRYMVTNMQPMGNQIELRLISNDESVPNGAILTEPGLEDAYLGLCGMEAMES